MIARNKRVVYIEARYNLAVVELDSGSLSYRRNRQIVIPCACEKGFRQSLYAKNRTVSLSFAGYNRGNTLHRLMLICYHPGVSLPG